VKKLLLLFTLLSATAYSQPMHIDSAKWIMDDLNFLSFHGNKVEYSFDGQQSIKPFHITKDTLIMTDTYYRSRAKDAPLDEDRYKFLIQHINHKKLTLVPVDSNARRVAPKSVYHFKNMAYSIDPKFHFTKLTFQSSMCYGECPVLLIEIDHEGNYFLLGGEYAEPFKGYFKGRLNAGQLVQLNRILQQSQLKRMYTWQQRIVVVDAQDYFISIYSNQKPLYIHTNWPPLNIKALIGFLMASYKNLALVPDPDKHKFERELDKFSY
jgi:hypothetical protein